MFHNHSKVTVDKEAGEVRVSTRVSDRKVEVTTYTIAEFKLLVAQFQAQLDGE